MGTLRIVAALFAIYLLFGLGGCVGAPDASARGDSTAGYVPPAEQQREIPPLVPLDREAAIGVGAAGITAGFVVSAIGIAGAYGAAERGYDSPSVQRGIVLSGSGVLLSALSALIIERARAPARSE